MPELPEVETVRLQLSSVLPNLIITTVTAKRPKSLHGNATVLSGKTIKQIRRYSKLLIIDLSDNISLAIHLRMTGRLIFDRDVNQWDINYQNDRHTHITFQFDNGNRLFFHDQRTFGYIQVIPTHDVEQLSYVQTLGPEFFRNLTADQFVKILHNAKRAIKVILLDQQKVGGVGNIYANEGLWMAQIHPETPSNAISESQSRKLFHALSDIMQKAISLGGASRSDFRDVYGKKGTVQDHVAVYERAGKPCLRCKEPIKKIIFAGRGTYLCERCQKSPY